MVENLTNGVQDYLFLAVPLTLEFQEIGLNGVKNEKRVSRKKIQTFFSVPHSSPNGYPGDMILNASVRDCKSLDLDGSFYLLALPQPEL